MAVREKLNRRLQNSELGKPILDWLNALPKVRKVLAAQFGGRSISHQNLSKWRLGGWREWQARQEALGKVGEIASDAAEMKQLAGEPVTDKLAPWLAACYYVALKSAMEAGDKADELKLLHKFCADMATLRRGDHRAARLKLERECSQGGTVNYRCLSCLLNRKRRGNPDTMPGRAAAFKPIQSHSNPVKPLLLSK
jgi:hypothetical protein